jgi:hypothetical protein
MAASFLSAGRLQLHLGPHFGAVLADHLDKGSQVSAADRIAVDQETLLASGKLEHEFGNGNVRNRPKCAAQAAVYAVDLSGHLDVDLTLEVDDEVGEFVGGGAQIG